MMKLPHQAISRLTRVNGCFVVEMPIYEDMRGFFMEAFKEKDFHQLGLPTVWAQDNQSGSKKGVLRGMHIQRRNPQGKLVRCVKGSIYDVCLDLRPDSPTFLAWHSEMLTGGKAMYCPPGTAHGFLAVEDDSVVYYKCTTAYDPETDGGVHCYFGNDILWPIREHEAIMSLKDKEMPTVEQWLENRLGVWNE